jgi:RNA polymerase sigma-54 factor
MNLIMNQTQELHMKLMLTPEIRESLHVLQLSGYDLSQYLLSQTEENPILEIDTYGDIPWHSKPYQQKKQTQKDYLWEARTRNETLEQWLISQLRMMDISTSQCKMAIFLAGSLDEKGYLTLSISEACLILQQPKESVELALLHLQSLEPAGVGARDLQECLLLQISRDPHALPGAYEVISIHLQQLALGRTDKIALQLGMSLEKVKDIFIYVKKLNPRPGLAFMNNEDHFIIPDASVTMEEGKCIIRMNLSAFAKISFNQDYCGMLVREVSSQTSTFLKEKFKSAHSLVRSVEQRGMTLQRVMKVIFEKQISFLEHGDRGLRPLNLKMVSEQLELHESTVSRAVQNKYVWTCYGALPLKYFFDSGLGTSLGENASVKAIKSTIKEIIARENKVKPYSDLQLVEILKQEGISISRRTVAKYRDELHVLSSALRKRV